MSGELLSRRQVAKWLALTSVAPSLSSCARRLESARVGVAPSVRRLARVLVAENRVIRQVAGLRPFRRGGFRVEAAALGDKSLIHNYGHGGGGVSLSWGTAQLAVERALETPHRQAAVLGCGAVGLATARLLQDRGFGVTIYARDLPPDTTSNIAGAQWNPVSVVDNDRRTTAFDAQFDRAARFAYRYFQLLAGPKYGVSWRENYFLSETPRQQRGGIMALIGDLLPVEHLAPNEHPFGRLHCSRMITMHIEPSVFLPAVLADFRVAGGRVVLQTFSDAQSCAQLPEPLIVNCTGLGAAALFGDPDLLPIKGQLTVLVPQQEIDYITIGPGDLYMMPRLDGIVLGGTYERGVDSLEPDAAQARRILNGHRALFDGLTR